MDPCRWLDGEVGCRSSSAPDAQPASPPTGAGRRWLDLDGENRSLPDWRKEPGVGAIRAGMRRPPGAVAASRFGRRSMSSKPQGREGDGDLGRGMEDREEEKGGGERFNGGRFQVCDLDPFADSGRWKPCSVF
jgi:hypothetical protein